MTSRLESHQFTLVEGDYIYELVRLNEDVVLNGATLRRGTTCALFGETDFQVRLARITEDQFVQNVPCKAVNGIEFFGFEPLLGDFNISFHPSGLLEHAVLARDYQVNGVELPASTILWLQADMQEWSAYLPEDRTILGIPCKARPDWYPYGEAIGTIGIDFDNNGQIRATELAGPWRIGGDVLPAEAYVEFYADGPPKAMRFAGSLTLDGVVWQGDKDNADDNVFDLYFHPNGRLERGHLTHPALIQGAQFAAGDQVQFAASGALLRTPRTAPLSESIARELRTPIQRHPLPLLSRWHDLLQAITETTADYRAGEIAPITPEHVERWVDQFEEHHQLEILEETSHWLSQWYVSRATMTEFLNGLVSVDWLMGDDPRIALAQTSFLNIQERSGSQRDLLAVFGGLLGAQYGLRTEDCGTKATHFVYLDDCLFSGNRARDDLRGWARTAPEGSRLTLVFFAAHTQGVVYLRGQLEPVLRARGISLSIRAALQIRNRAEDGEQFDSFWPREVRGDDEVDAYIELLRKQARRWGIAPRIFRPEGVPANDTLCSSPAGRERLERELLKAGAHIVALPKNPREIVRPLGWDKLHSLGFGASVVMYRNISNNCPLAFWWGNPDAPDWHPLSRWYPLFPRKENKSNDFGLREPLGWWRTEDDQ